MVAVDFNGTAWRKKSGVDQQRDSTIEEPFSNTNLPIAHGPSPLWGPGDVAGEWPDVCGFIKPSNTVNEYGAFEINREVLGIRPTDQSCHHEVWIHLSHVDARLVDQYRSRRARKQAIHMTTCDHSHCARKVVIHMTTCISMCPATQENVTVHEQRLKASTHQGVRRMNSLSLQLPRAGALLRLPVVPIFILPSFARSQVTFGPRPSACPSPKSTLSQ